MDSSSSLNNDSSEVESIVDSSIQSKSLLSTKEDLEISATDDEEEQRDVRNQKNETGSSRASQIAQESDSSEESEEEDIVHMPQNKRNIKKIISDDSDESSDEDERKRRSFYVENPEGDLCNIVEDQPFSKATRRSIMGFGAVKAEPTSDQSNSNDDDDDESDIIISETESEPEQENFDNSEVAGKNLLSSTFRSPLKELHSDVSINKEASVTPKVLKKVSRSFYQAQLAEIEGLNSRFNSLNKICLGGSLPDGGAKLRVALEKIKEDISNKENEIKLLIVDEEDSIKSQIAESFKSTTDRSSIIEVSNDSNNDFLTIDDVQPKFTGKIGLKNFEEKKALTVEKLQDIHRSLDQRPADDVFAEQPKYLKIDLMKHQLHAIAFMQWRETQKPKGGILADDMGLGKTLTVISLILKQMQDFEEMGSEEEQESDEDEEDRQKEDEWVARGHKALRDGGTLIVCPATLINQWEQEIKTKVKRNALNVNVFHGAKRIYKAKELSRYDVVITTYQIILSEFKNNGCLFGIKWERIVLDEGHVIRNYKSKQSEAVCSLFGRRRWVLTGTPIQNKEFDLFAAIKFLHCSPFDDLRYWRMWIETKKGRSSPRLQALLKSILLRRTKAQLQENGEIPRLPDKIYEQCNVSLNHEERIIYNRMMALSQQVFAAYLAQQQEKHSNYTYDQNRLQKLHQKFARNMNVHHEIKPHEILTLLLRLRQICCHAGLVKQEIEKNELMSEVEISNDRNDSIDKSDFDILNKLQNLNINDKTSNEAIPSDNEVFNMDIPSSKIEKLMDELREKLVNSEDKAIIVSQWVSFLNIVKGMLEVENIDYCELNGSIPVKFRNDIVVDFNNPLSSKKVMLLSITAGGVGLNLVGANMLFIMDPHWNPQIEQQAQDRIYRFGQKKNIKIYKFICEDTIEEKILTKQQEKMDLATSTLTGSKRSATKLTIEDLKDLFGMK